MRTGKRALLALVVPLVLAAGCAGGSERADTDSPGAERTGRSGREVVGVRLVVTGGIAGTHDVHVAGRDGSGGLTPAELDSVLTLAGSRSVRHFADEHLSRRAVRCCDLQVYELTIRYADGSRTHIKTPQTRTGPPEFRRLVALLSGR